MKAYQYFHLPSGYEAKVSDQNPKDLSFAEEIRKSIQSTLYFAYITNSEGDCFLLNSKLDEMKNQFIRGRIGKIEEFNNFPIGYIETIPDLRLMRADMNLMVRPYMVSSFAFKPYNLNASCLGALFDAITKNEDVIVSFNSQEEAVLTLKTVLNLLPLQVAKKVNFVIADTIGPNKVECLDAYGNKLTGSNHLNILNRPITDEEKTRGKYIDFTKPNVDVNSLSPLAKLIANSDISSPIKLNELKNNFANFIGDSGVDLGALDAVEKENNFLNNPSKESLHELLDYLPNIPADRRDEVLVKVGQYYASKYDSDEIEADEVKEASELANTYPAVASVTDNSYRNYLMRNYLSLEGQAKDDFALILGADQSAFDTFFNDTEAEVNARRKARRVAIIHSALISGTDGDYDSIRAKFRRLMALVDISNNYQLLTYEERTEGETIFYSIPLDGNLSDIDLDLLAFLSYSAYLKTTNEEWKRMRLRGLEIRLKELDILAKLRILIELRNRVEYYSNLFYGDEALLITDLNDYYFDIYGESLKAELKRCNFDAKLNFYNEFRIVPYLSLLNALSNSLCDLSLFLETYPELTREQIVSFLSLFEAMPQNKESATIVEYLRASLKEYELNQTFVNFRMGFIENCYNLLPQNEKDRLPNKPNHDDLMSTKIDFAEKLSMSVMRYMGDTALMIEIPVKTRESKFGLLEEPAQQMNSRNPQVNKVVKKTKVMTLIEAKPSSIKPFPVKITFECEEEIELPEIVFVAANRQPTSTDQGNELNRFKGGMLKKGLFGKPKIVYKFDSPKIMMNQQIFGVIEDPESPVSLQIIRD